MNKICTKCGIEKDLSEFHKSKNYKDGHISRCKICVREYGLEYRKENKSLLFERRTVKKQINPWLESFYKINQRCYNEKCKDYYRYGQRGIKNLLSIDEIKKLWFRDKAYWMKNPTIDRINNNGHYEYNNCQWIENEENIAKDKRKSIFQYDLEGNFVKEWNSITEAANYYNGNTSDLCKCLKGQRIQYKLFIWKYKYE
jgi:hypothetical protein